MRTEKRHPQLTTAAAYSSRHAGQDTVNVLYSAVQYRMAHYRCTVWYCTDVLYGVVQLYSTVQYGTVQLYSTTVSRLRDN